MEAINWRDIQAALAAPFDPAAISWRPDSEPRDWQGKMIARCVCYVDARDVQERLDAVLGCDGWGFSVAMVASGSGKGYAALGTLTIAGVSKSDAGEDETVKGAVSDALKRAGVQWGIGRYLYGVGCFYAECEQKGREWKIRAGELEKLASKLPRPSGRAAA